MASWFILCGYFNRQNIMYSGTAKVSDHQLHRLTYTAFTGDFETMINTNQSYMIRFLAINHSR
jgi:hypothetical protein